MPYLIAIVVALLLPAAASANLQADYQFNGSLNSEVGGAPKLKAIGDTDFAGGGGNGILTWKRGTCLRLNNAEKVIRSKSSYTIAMTVRLNDVDGYNKLADLDNQTTENGLYVDDGAIYTYPLDYSGELIQPNKFYELAMTRTPDGKVHGFIDGLRRAQGSDAADKDLVLGDDKILHFLCDDEVTSSEETGGRISRLRIFDDALSDGAVKHLGP